MTQYIDKSAIIAEIKRRIKEIDEMGTYLSPKGTLINLLCSLNTLEVKEVDYGIEVHKYAQEHFNVYDDVNQTLQTKENKTLLGRKDFEDIAKHFFELGLKTKG